MLISTFLRLFEFFYSFIFYFISYVKFLFLFTFWIQSRNVKSEKINVPQNLLVKRILMINICIVCWIHSSFSIPPAVEPSTAPWPELELHDWSRC